VGKESIRLTTNFEEREQHGKLGKKKGRAMFSEGPNVRGRETTEMRCPENEPGKKKFLF